MTRKPGLTYGEAFPIGGRMMAMDARLRARDAHDPHTDLMEFLTEKLNNPDDIATAGLMVKNMLEFFVKQERDGGAEDSALRRRVLAGDAKVKAEAGATLNTKFPALGRIGQA